MQITRLLLLIVFAACSTKPTGPDQRTAGLLPMGRPSRSSYRASPLTLNRYG